MTIIVVETAVNSILRLSSLAIPVRVPEGSLLALKRGPLLIIKFGPVALMTVALVILAKNAVDSLLATVFTISGAIDRITPGKHTLPMFPPREKNAYTLDIVSAHRISPIRHF